MPPAASDAGADPHGDDETRDGDGASHDATGDEARDGTGDGASPEGPPRPEFADPYLDRVADRLMGNFDLERDRAVDGRSYPLYGRMLVKNQKQFFVAALRYGYHESTQHLFVDRDDAVAVADLEADVALAHDLADDWITLDDDHFETEFAFVHVVPEIPDAVAAHVDGFRDRTLLKRGFKGHYEVHLVVVAPERERLVASAEADVARAFRFWDDDDAAADGLVARVRRLLP